MRAALLFIALALSGCSLLVDPRGKNEYDLRDGGRQGFDGGERDAGRADAGVDAGPAIPAAPVLRFPWNGYMTGSVHTGALPAERNALRPRFVWEPSEGAERYELQLTSTCEAQTRASCAFDGAIDGVTSETEWRPDEALPVSMSAPVGRRYVWRARACNAADCSGWSAVRYLDVGRQPTDFNGDGYADLLIGAPGEAVGAEARAGRAYTFYGPAPADSARTYQTEHPAVASAAFGGVVAAVGDVNGDGFPDAVVTSPWALGAAGRASLFPGRADRVSMRPEATIESLHPTSEGLFGVAVAGAGDFDGDGFADVVISADGEEVDGVRSAGCVYVFRGSAASIVTPSVELTSPTPTPAGRFGHSVSAGGDVNGDGNCDLEIAAPAEKGGSVAGAGRVHLYWDPLAGGPPDASLTSGTPTSSGMFGMSVQTGSDYNGDGFADIAIGAPAEEVDGAALAGRVYIFEGSRDGVGSLPTLTVSGAPAIAQSFFGLMLAGADLNGDGVDDLAVGAPHRSVASITVFLGSTDASLSSVATVMDPASEGGSFGAALAVGDVDGDGVSDLVVGAPTRTVSGSAQAGSVHGFMNDVEQIALEPAWSLTSTESDGRFGAAMSQTVGTWFGERE